MAKKKVSRKVVSKQPTTEDPRVPLGFEVGRENMVANLQQVSKGASLILLALNDSFSSPGKINNTVTSGIGEALAIVADEVELYLFEKPVGAGAPHHELYVLEKEAAKLRAKIAAKQRGRS